MKAFRELLIWLSHYQLLDNSYNYQYAFHTGGFCVQVYSWAVPRYPCFLSVVLCRLHSKPDTTGVGISLVLNIPT